MKINNIFYLLLTVFFILKNNEPALSLEKLERETPALSAKPAAPAAVAASAASAAAAAIAHAPAAKKSSEGDEKKQNAMKKEDAKLAAITAKGRFAGYGFTPEGSYVLVDNLDGAPSRQRVSLLGNQIEILIVRQKFCIGSYDLESMEGSPCPDRAAAEGGHQNCAKCFKKTGFNPAFYKFPKESLSPQQQKYNLNNHYVYLAYFNNGVPKVGIAYKPRLFGRWLEQGALATTIVAECSDAYKARELEAQISAMFKLPEGYSSLEKNLWLQTPFDIAMAQKVLAAHRTAIMKGLKLDAGEAVVYDLTGHYSKKPINFKAVGVVSTKASKLVGTCIGIFGDNMYFETSTGLYVQSLKKLVGKSLITVIAK
jgi:hypothetical protein